MSEDAEFALGRQPGMLYVSKAFTSVPPGDGEQPEARSKRFAYRVFENGKEIALADVKKERVIHVTPSGRQQIKALFYVDNREITSLTLQRFNRDNKPLNQHFTFTGDEIGMLLEFVRDVENVKIDDEERLRLDIANLHRYQLTSGAAEEVARQNLATVANVVEREVTERDVVAIAYRRTALKRFRRMLDDPDYFNAEAEALGGSAEAVWQRFFEENTWIFGYGLFYIFTSGLPDRKLEQVVAGHSVASAGKRSDALLMSHGRIGSLCFGEIKTHRAPLIETDAYRPETWAPSRDLVRAVAQVQRTVEKAEANIRGRLDLRDKEGNAVGDSLFVIRPRSIVVIGSLTEFVHAGRVNEPKFSSFELFRRQLTCPDILTFDELYERARFITESEANKRNIHE